MRLDTTSFNPHTCLNSGQAFHWFEDEQGFYGLIDHEFVRLSRMNDLSWEVEDSKLALVNHYFRLDESLKKQIATFPKKDKHLKAAMQAHPGLRILRQPIWECLAAFITSAMKQVAHIRQMSLAIRSRWGDPVEAEGLTLFAYPSPEVLASQSSEALLRTCSLGFRAKPLYRTACLLAEGKLDLEALRKVDDETLLEALCTLPGVGPKIAQCVMLFAYDRPLAFPVDVWIERVLREWYFPGRETEVTSKELLQFAYSHFGPYRGLAQQWLFHHARTGTEFSRKRKRE